jgi:hypothetical protein
MNFLWWIREEKFTVISIIPTFEKCIIFPRVLEWKECMVVSKRMFFYNRSYPSFYFRLIKFDMKWNNIKTQCHTRTSIYAKGFSL